MQVAHIPEYAAYLDEPLPDEVRQVPSMMSEKERKLLFGIAQHAYTGAGVIVDAGVFCGASTVCFALGVRANERVGEIRKRWRAPIRTFESGIVNPGMISFFERHGIEGDWAVGDSFVPLLKKYIAPFSGLVRLRLDDICTYKWKSDPIEVMFLDVLKSEEITRHVVGTFYRNLTPGSIVVQQDYFIDGLPFVKIAQEALAPWFSYLGEVSSSAVFRLTKSIPPEVLDTDFSHDLDLSERVRLLDQARDRSIDADRTLMCELGKVRFLASVDGEGAVDLLQGLPERFPEQLQAKPLPRIAMAMRVATNAVNAARAHRT